MTEREVKIKLTTGGQSLKEMQAALRSIDDLRKSVSTASPEFARLSRESAALRTQIQSLQQASYSANAKMKESYFSTGEELRRFYREQRLGDRTMREGVSTR
jgi:predicted  nucleic acid-binding Zn-ribbon protein